VVEASATGRDEEAVRRFIERFALNLVEAGMARMPAWCGVEASPGGQARTSGSRHARVQGGAIRA
jgi:hypothetical protein